jgi:hypothetical protein
VNVALDHAGHAAIFAGCAGASVAVYHRGMRGSDCIRLGDRAQLGFI